MFAACLMLTSWFRFYKTDIRLCVVLHLGRFEKFIQDVAILGALDAYDRSQVRHDIFVLFIFSSKRNVFCSIYLRQLCDAFQEHKYAEGDCIIQQGEAGNHFYVRVGWR